MKCGLPCCNIHRLNGKRKEGVLKENRYYKSFILYVLFVDYLKDLCEPKLVRSLILGDLRAILNISKES